MNLVINASEAIGDRSGVITIRDRALVYVSAQTLTRAPRERTMTMSLFTYVAHPRIAARKDHPPRTTGEQHKLGFNGTLGKTITGGVGIM